MIPWFLSFSPASPSMISLIPSIPSSRRSLKSMMSSLPTASLVGKGVRDAYWQSMRRNSERVACIAQTATVEGSASLTPLWLCMQRRMPAPPSMMASLILLSFCPVRMKTLPLLSVSQEARRERSWRVQCSVAKVCPD
jgi:hypothetical protein